MKKQKIIKKCYQAMISETIAGMESRIINVEKEQPNEQ